MNVKSSAELQLVEAAGKYLSSNLGPMQEGTKLFTQADPNTILRYLQALGALHDAIGHPVCAMTIWDDSVKALVASKIIAAKESAFAYSALAYAAEVAHQLGSRPL